MSLSEQRNSEGQLKGTASFRRSKLLGFRILLRRMGRGRGGAWKLGAISLAGFSLPILLSLLFAPLLFDDSFITPPHIRAEYSRAMLDTPEGEINATGALPGASEPETSFIQVPSDPSLDPQSGKTFIVSFLARFQEFPPVGKRRKVVFKYAANKVPYQGWAIAWRRSETSLRPEVYWKDGSGRGGWFSFDDVELEIEKTYLVTLLAQPGDFISLYLQERPDLSAGARFSNPAAQELRPGPLHFAGGHSLDGITMPKTSDRLYVRTGLSKPGDLTVKLDDVLLGHAAQPPSSREALNSALSAGATSMAKFLGEDGTALLLDSFGRDRSRHARSL